jgi:hypothetical protein
MKKVKSLIVKRKPKADDEKKLMKSQTRGLWVSVIISILFSLGSLLFSILTYFHNEKENLSISIDLLEENYLTYYTCFDDSIFWDDGSITFKFIANIINLGKNPATLISYCGLEPRFMRNEDLKLFNKSKLRKPEYNELLFDKPILLQPGESYKYQFSMRLNIDRRICKLLEKTHPDKAYDIMRLVYQSNTDLFGNKIGIDSSQALRIEHRRDSIGNTISDSSQIMIPNITRYLPLNQGSFYYTLRTAKGNIFVKKFIWYTESKGGHLPFRQVLPVIKVFMPDKEI